MIENQATSTATVEQELPPGFELFDHFLRLATKGRHPGASGGEKRAARLAAAVLDHAPGLDSDATAGLKMFLDLAQSNHDLACRVVGLES